MPELVVITWYGLFAPSGINPQIVSRLHDEFAKMMKLPEVKSKLAQVELDATTSASPAEFAAFIASEIPRLAKAVQISGAKVE